MRHAPSKNALLLMLAALLPGCGSTRGDAATWSADGGSTDGGGGGGGGDDGGGDGGGDGGSDGTGDVKFDVPVDDLGGGVQPPATCDNVEESVATSVGCEFWAIDLLEFHDAAHGLAVGVGNPGDLEVQVTIEDRRGAGGSVRVLHQLSLAPRSSQMIEINQGAGAILPYEDHDLTAADNVAAAFRITTDVPVTAMQINPMGGAPTWVPEASMLLPTNALGTAYTGLAYENAYAESWVVVVAINDGTTVTTSEGSVTLDAFDAYKYEMIDATGFAVRADRPVAVYSGAAGTHVPVGQPWSDHLEEQLVPLSAWSTKYVGARHPRRVPEINPAPEPVQWRIIAGLDDTRVTLTPAQPEVGSSVSIANAGDFVEFAATESFLAESPTDTPFMLVEYMTGGEKLDPTTDCMPGRPVGDPYMLQAVPIDQWLERLPFLTDTSYARDFVTISREQGTAVELTCLGVVPDDRFTAIPGTPYEVGHVDLDLGHAGGEGNCVDGQQFLTASKPVGVHVGGVDCAASYGYPGGLSLEALWVPPQG